MRWGKETRCFSRRLFLLCSTLILWCRYKHTHTLKLSLLTLLHSSSSCCSSSYFSTESRYSFAAHLHYSFYIYILFFCRFTLHLILSPRLVGVCVCGAAVISEEESECKREGGEPLSCVRASATGMERLVGGWDRRRQRHLWSGPTNLIFHVSPSRSHSLRTKLSHKNVYFVSPHICF